MELKNKQTGYPTQNYALPWNKYNQEEPIIQFTKYIITIANKAILKVTIFPKHNKPWFTGNKNTVRECQENPRKFKTNLISEDLNKHK